MTNSSIHACTNSPIRCQDSLTHYILSCLVLVMMWRIDYMQILHKCTLWPHKHWGHLNGLAQFKHIDMDKG